jgi:hypothetical protein
MEIEVGETEEFYNLNNYVIELKEINRPKTVAILNDHSVFYSLTKTDVFNLPAKPSVFTFNSRYSSETF